MIVFNRIWRHSSAVRKLHHGWELILLGLLMVSGCSTLPSTPQLSEAAAAVWKERQTRLQTLEQWQLNAKIGVHTSLRGGSATLRWQHAPFSQQLELYGPLGGGRVRITVDASGALLEDTTGEVLKGGDAADLLYRRLGWGVPFDMLSSWIRGLPGTDATESEIDDQGLLRRTRASGWEVEILDYSALGEDLLPRSMRIHALPGTVKIYSDTGEYLGDELRVKLIVKSWQELVFSG